MKKNLPSNVPGDLQNLQNLPGIGPKMANLTLSVAFPDKPRGICVDSHMHRLLPKVGWTDTDTHTTPEKTREELERFLPKAEWRGINELLVGLGQLMLGSTVTQAYLVDRAIRLDACCEPMVGRGPWEGTKGQFLPDNNSLSYEKRICSAICRNLCCEKCPVRPRRPRRYELLRHN